MHMLSGQSAQLPVGVAKALSVYRHKVFVEMLGWQLDTPPGIEQDQFDREDTVYIVSRDAEERITGCARLLPTTQPYLLGEVFPQLLNGLPAPNSPEVWELSRFAAVDFQGPTGTAGGQFISPLALELLREAIHCAAQLGAKTIITVSPVGIERILRNAGFHAHRAGPPMIIDGYPLFACVIDVENPLG